ncbi:hypothetical protein WI25_28685 [Burkholderia cepacia]|uniref:conjugal transfer protein TraD n=1 Tax=Burkholderia cepacia TaxID=292 RepID=UPI0007571F17|nr:conjugal transfer protein TraD [Burkholderia cepacia]KUY63383.1 hypothetical protein WI25_28685 [Burkholderia cepacia]
MEKNDWLVKRIEYIRGLKAPTDAQKMLLELAAIASPSKQEVKQIDALVRLEKVNQKAEEAKAEVARMMADRREQERKARTRELIELGGIVSMTGFPVDRGMLTGALLWALDQMKTDTSVERQLKTRGDTFIAAREKTPAASQPDAPVEA